MSKNLLSLGDVIDLVPGMEVYAKLPECFVYANRRNSPLDKLARTNIRLGDVLGNERGGTFDTSRLCGRYVVQSTSYTGGGVQSAMSGGTESWPDGYCVVASKLASDGSYDENGEKVWFYQTGCFTAMVRPGEIAPVAKMRQTFEHFLTGRIRGRN